MEIRFGALLSLYVCIQINSVQYNKVWSINLQYLVFYHVLPLVHSFYLSLISICYNMPSVIKLELHIHYKISIMSRNSKFILLIPYIMECNTTWYILRILCYVEIIDLDYIVLLMLPFSLSSFYCPYVNLSIYVPLG